MNTVIKYRLLDAMKVTPWVPRDPILRSKDPVYGAVCLVLLPEKPSSLSIEHHKTFIGMLSVLELNASKLCVAWLDERIKQVQSDILFSAIQKYFPFSVLIIGKKFSETLSLPPSCSDFFIRDTYHPTELVLNKDYKRKAYQELLDFKALLGAGKIT